MPANTMFLQSSAEMPVAPMTRIFALRILRKREREREKGERKKYGEGEEKNILVIKKEDAERECGTALSGTPAKILGYAVRADAHCGRTHARRQLAGSFHLEWNIPVFILKFISPFYTLTVAAIPIPRVEFAGRTASLPAQKAPRSNRQYANAWHLARSFGRNFCGKKEG